MTNYLDGWTIGQRYNVFTTKGRIEVQVVGLNNAIFSAEYRAQRWHGKLDGVKVGHEFDGGVVNQIKERV